MQKLFGVFSKVDLKFFVIVVFFAFQTRGWCNPGLEIFFGEIKMMNYENARDVLDSENDAELTDRLRILLTLLEERNSLDPYHSINTTVEQRIIYRLINGYNELFKPDYSSLLAYQEFSKALNLSNNSDFKEVTKFCLISILEILRKEIFIGSNQFLIYLNHFEELKSSPEDEIIFRYYDVVFASKENEDIATAPEYDLKMKRLDTFFENYSDVHSYRAFYLYEKGAQYKLEGDYLKASVSFNEALLRCNKPYLRSLKSTLYWQLSHNYLLTGELKNSEHFLRKSVENSKGMRGLFYDQRLKAWILNAKQEFDSAYYYLDRSIETEYKMGAKNNSLETALLSVENETDKLKLDNFISENRRKSTRNWLVGATILLLLGFGIAVLLQKNTTKKRKLAEQEAQIEQQKVTTLLREQELVSIDAMIAGQEKERQKVANELHDDLGSLMATVKLHFDNVKVDQKDPAMKNAQALLEKAYQKIRGMAHMKNSGVMANQGFLPAVKKMAQTVSETNALQVTIEDFGLVDRMENSLELTLFRILQELIANIIKHAEATQANIQFTQHEDKLNIIVEDNGKGFDISGVLRNKNGMGLGTIEKRIEYLEGTFTVDSVLGKGTSILIDIPI